MTSDVLLAIIGMALPGVLALGGGWVRVARLERDCLELKAEHARVTGELKAAIEERVPRELWKLEVEGLRMQLAEIKGMLTPYRMSKDDTNPGRQR